MFRAPLSKAFDDDGEDYGEDDDPQCCVDMNDVSL